MKKNRGMVLISVLFIASMLLLLTISQWQGVVLHQKLINSMEERSRLLFNLEEGVDILFRNLNYELLDEEHGVIKRNGLLMNYKIKPLGDFPCVHRVIKGLPHSTRHFLIQAWLPTDAVVLKLRLAHPIPLIPCESQLYRVVNSTVLSWSHEETKGSSL